VLKDRAWIERHIPHQGTMCLLDQVLDWNLDHVRCLSRAHRSADNPLRARGRLGAVCGIEFAAQAMAVHGALLAPELHLERRAGYLASVRGVELLASRLDDIEADLVAAADRLGGDDSTVLYRFSLSAGTRPLVTGRATIVINPAALARGFTPAST
jgi:predicted hotdog family 3-hydroxylacyl-ACP dehydratase